MLTADEYMSVNPRDNKDQFVKSQRYLGMYSSLSPRIALLIFVLQQMVYYLLPAEYQIIPIYLLSYSLSPPTAFFLCELAVSSTSSPYSSLLLGVPGLEHLRSELDD